MNAQASPAPVPAPAIDTIAGDGPAFSSVTIWSSDDYFIQIHYGHFDSWEEAEDFAGSGELHLEQRSNALFLVGPHGAAFIADQAMTIYRNYDNSFAGGATFDMTFDDLLEVADVDDMRLCAIGSQPALRGRPIVARHVAPIELQSVSAANDDAE